MRPTLDTIALRAGVCKATVSLALRNAPKIPLETRQRIRQIAEEIGYRVNPLVAAHMADLRQHHPTRHAPAIAYLTQFSQDQTKSAFHRQRWLDGVTGQCENLGYALDIFYSVGSSLSTDRLRKVLETRGTLGLIIGPFENDRAIGPAFLQGFAAIAISRRERSYPVYTVDTDHVGLALGLVRRLRESGFTRPAIYHSSNGTGLNERLLHMAYNYALSQPPALAAPPLFFGETSPPRKNGFASWVKKCRPDVLISNITEPLSWLHSCGLRTPEDLSFVSENLVLSEDFSTIAGFDQHYEQAGAAAVNLLISQLHRNDFGLPAHPKTLLIEATWNDGSTFQRLPDD